MTKMEFIELESEVMQEYLEGYMKESIPDDWSKAQKHMEEMKMTLILAGFSAEIVKKLKEKKLFKEDE